MSNFNQQEYGELRGDVKYLKACCDSMKADMRKIEEEQASAKNRTIGTLVGIIITLGFIILSYFRQ